MITVLVSVVLGPTYEQSMSEIEFWAVSAILEIMSGNKWHWHLIVNTFFQSFMLNVINVYSILITDK